MPRIKGNRGKLKTISCPRCGKKFCSETNVLQHMNQPSGSCRSTWHDDVTRTLHQVHVGSGSPEDLGDSISDSYDQELGLADPDITMDMENETDDRYLGGPNNQEFAHPDPDSDFAPDLVNRTEFGQGTSGSFVENYEDCSEAFPGGKSFMDNFRQDQYAAERQQNLYYPFASREEWEFASWLLRSRLSISAIDSLLALDILKRIPLSFRSGKQLRSRAETLPSGPAWLCETITPEGPTKNAVRVFYRQPLECLQELLSNPLLAPYISFVPRKVWTSAAKICRVYDDWLSGDQSWDIQRELPVGSTQLSVILSSDKTNISVISGNRMAHPVLISLANIDAKIRGKTSLHTYMLLALLPIPKFLHKNTRVRSLWQDRLFHKALDLILRPLKIAASVGVMMNDPVGNMRYCFTPLAAWIADTPEQCLIAGTSPKASPITTAMSKNFGDSFRHPPRTASVTLNAIRVARSKQDPPDYKAFLKSSRELGLNGVLDPFWKDWSLSDPASFLHTEPLHHFHRFCWDHDTQWCITVVGAQELDFRFSLIQSPVGYRSFQDGVSRLKQVTGRDHRAVQRYLVAVIAGAVPPRFLTAIRALMDFRYLAQAPCFTDDSISKVSQVLQEFHDQKDAVVRAGGRKDGQWGIPKLELLQGVVPDIRRSGPIMQWSADPTEHAHVQDIKIPARAGNNQDYYSQIARYLDRSEKCLRFDIATYLEGKTAEGLREDNMELDQDEEHEPDEDISLSDHLGIRPFARTNYFEIAQALFSGCLPNAPRPHRTFSTATTAFHLSLKPSLRLSIDEAAAKFDLADFRPALQEYFSRLETSSPHVVSGIRNHPQGSNLSSERIQIWYKLRIQQMSYYSSEDPDAPQTVRAIPPSRDHPYGLYDAVVVSTTPESSWPKHGLEGHSIVQLRAVFRLLHSDSFLAYVQGFEIVPHRGSNTHPGSGMHLLRRAVRPDGVRIGDIVPITLIRSPAHLVPYFGEATNNRLTHQNSYELCTEFWLNKYWSKDFYYALSD